MERRAIAGKAAAFGYSLLSSNCHTAWTTRPCQPKPPESSRSVSR